MYNKKTLSKASAELDKAKAPKKPKDIITDPMGQWKYPGLPTRIPSNDITMKGVGYPVLGVANNGQRKIMLPGADYTFPGADYVDEYPQMRKGGAKKKKTRSLSGTNKIMLTHPLLQNYKNKVYDPNVDYFQDGGYIETELTDDQIDEYRKGGYIVEDISVPELNQAQKGKTVKNKVLEISDPKEFAYRKKMYNDSLALYNKGQEQNKIYNEFVKSYGVPKKSLEKYTNALDVTNKINPQIEPILGKSFFYNHNPDVIAGTNISDKRVKGIDPVNIYKKPTQPVKFNKNAEKPVVIDREKVANEPIVNKSKTVDSKIINKINTTNYPEGYQPYSLYGRVLDPEVYGYAKSINGKPVEAAQFGDTYGYKAKMDEYKKSGKYPWVKQEGGLIEAQNGIISTKEHTDKKGNKTIKVQKEDGTVYTKVIGKDGKVYNRTFDPKKDSWATDQTKNLYSKAQGSGNSDWFWAPAALTAITAAPLVKSAATAVGEGIVAGGDAIANATLNKLGKNSFLRATKAAYNAAPSWLPSGATANNLLTAAGATYGAAEYFDKNSDIRKAYSKVAKDPTLRNVGDAVSETGLNMLNFSGLNVGKNLKNASKYATKVADKVAHGETILPYAWKSRAQGVTSDQAQELYQAIKNKKPLTEWQHAMIRDYAFDSSPYTGRWGNVDKVLRSKLNNLIKKTGMDVPENTVLIRRINSEDPKLFNLKNKVADFGDRPVSFSAGRGADYNGPKDRIVLSGRNAKKASKNFIKNEHYTDYSDDVLNKIPEDLRASYKSLPELVLQERELIGTDLNLRKIGKVKNELGGHDYIMKPKGKFFKEGGVVAELSDDEIQDYINQGYIVEDLNGDGVVDMYDLDIVNSNMNLNVSSFTPLISQ